MSSNSNTAQHTCLISSPFNPKGGKPRPMPEEPDFDRAWYTGPEHCSYCDGAFNIPKDCAMTDKEKIQDLDHLSACWDVKMEIAAAEREHREPRAAAAKQEREKRKVPAEGDARDEWLRLLSAVGGGASKEDGVKEEAHNNDDNADDD